MEDRIRAGFEHTDRGMLVRMSPQAIEATLPPDRRRGRKAHPDQSCGDRPGQPADPRRAKQITATHLPNLTVLSYNEVTRDTKIESVAMVADGKQ